MHLLPLSDITVLDLSHRVAGAFTAKALAWQGAEVIKVEAPPEGDEARKIGPFFGDIPDKEGSSLFLYLNTDKKSLTLDLEREAGKKALKDLVKVADILIEDYHPGVMAGLGLGYEELEKINRGLIMVSISNFGQSGPYRDFKGTDLTLLAIGGLSYMVGEPTAEPLKLAGYQAQYASAVNAFSAAMVALYGRDMTGEGEHVDISIMEVVAAAEWHGTNAYAANGKVRCRDGSFGGWHIMPANNGHVGIVYRSDYWPLIFKLIGREELIEDPNYATQEAREQHMDELGAIVLSWTVEHTKEEIYHSGQAAGLPFSAFFDMEDLLDSSQYKARQFLAEIEHPKTGKASYPGVPFKMEGLTFPADRAPLLGEHTHEILKQRLGYSEEDIAKLSSEGVI